MSFKFKSVSKAFVIILLLFESLLSVTDGNEANMEGKDIQLSKSLTWLLRHGAVSEGVKVDENGYIKVNDILNHRLFSSRCTINDIRRIVALSRQKFTLKTNFLEGYLEIRANRGHTFKKTLLLTGTGTLDTANRKPGGFFDVNTINEKHKQHLRQFDAQFLSRQQVSPVRHSLKYPQPLHSHNPVTPRRIQQADVPENTRRNKLMDYTELTRVLNWLLRYGCAREKIVISPEGFVNVNDILDNRFFRGRCSFEDIHVVALNEPFNYECVKNSTTETWKIRALEEHPIKKKFPDWTYITHPAYLPFRYIIHGVNGSEWIKIIKKGIKCPPRSYIYFSPYEAEDSQSTQGVSKYDDIFIYVDADAAMQDGIEFYKTAVDAITTKGKKGYVSVEYFLKVVDAKTGLTHCTKAVLTKIFSRFGKVEDISDFNNDRPFSFIRFSDNKCVQKAIRARLFWQGKRLFVREVKPQSQSKEENTSTTSSVHSEEGSLNQELKDKNAIGDEELPVHIPDPKEYSGDCSSVFEWQVNSFISQIEMDKTSDHLNQICKDVESIFAPILPGVRPVIFGSCLTGLAFKNSDLDIFMECLASQPGEDFVKHEAKVIYKTKLVKEAFRIPAARVPIVRFIHKSTNMQCDVVFKNKIGVCNSKLIKLYLELDERIKPLIIISKYWGRVYRVTGIGNLTNYALVMLFIFYLQQTDPPVLPTVLNLQEAAEIKEYVDGWNCSFINNSWFWQSKNNSTLKDLLSGFFKFYSEYDFNNVICPLLGNSFPVSDFENPDMLPESMNAYKEKLKSSDKNQFKHDAPIRIQDPFELCYNLGRGLQEKDVERFKKVCAHSWNICRDTEEHKILEILFTIDETSLLSIRENHSYTIDWHMQGIGHQIDPLDKDAVNSWFMIVKESVLGIFEKIFKFDLQYSENGELKNMTNKNCSNCLKNMNASDKLQLICKGRNKIWLQRKKCLKLSKFFFVDPFEQEVWTSDEVLRRNSTDLQLNLKAIILPVQTSEAMPVVKLSVIDYGPLKNNHFREFISYFSLSFTDFVKKSLVHFATGKQNIKIVEINKNATPFMIVPETVSSEQNIKISLNKNDNNQEEQTVKVDELLTEDHAKDHNYLLGSTEQNCATPLNGNNQEEQKVINNQLLQSVQDTTNNNFLLGVGMESVKGNLGQKRTDELSPNFQNVVCPKKKRKKRKNKNKQNSDSEINELTCQNQVFNVETNKVQSENITELNQSIKMETDEKVLATQKRLLLSLIPKCENSNSLPLVDENLKEEHTLNNNIQSVRKNLPNSQPLIKCSMSVYEYCQNADPSDPFVVAINKIAADIKNNK